MKAHRNATQHCEMAESKEVLDTVGTNKKIVPITYKNVQEHKKLVLVHLHALQLLLHEQNLYRCPLLKKTIPTVPNVEIGLGEEKMRLSTR